MIWSQCVLWYVKKSICILWRILWKKVSFQGFGFHVAGSNALVLLKIHWKSCIFPQFSFFPYPPCCCWWNKILSMKKFEGKKCMFTWVTFQEKPNVWFVLFTISLFNHRRFFLALSSRGKEMSKMRNLSFSSRFFLRFISFGKVFCCVLNQRQLYFTGQKWAF